MQARILVVDDDPNILNALEKRLLWMGHEVCTAEDGEQALRLVTDDQPDLMLLDIELSGLSGLALLKQLRERRSTDPAQRIPGGIVLTAFGTIGRAVEAMQLGASDFLTKPFEPDHLSMVIDNAMAQMALMRQIGLLRAEVEAGMSILWDNAARWCSCWIRRGRRRRLRRRCPCLVKRGREKNSWSVRCSRETSASSSVTGRRLSPSVASCPCRARNTQFPERLVRHRQLSRRLWNG